jgi:hypothetical protein
VGFVLLLPAIGVIFFGGGLSEAILLHGLDLKTIREEWVLDGAPQELRLDKYTNPTNSARCIFAYTNTFILNGKRLESVFAMDALNFDGRGILIITKDGTLVWLDKKKGPEIVRLPGRYVDKGDTH